MPRSTFKTWLPRIVACTGALGVCIGSCVFATGAVSTLDGCVDDDADITVDDVTGIVVRSDALFAPTGCGTNPGEVYRYLAVIHDPVLGNGPIPNGFAVYPCYSDADFSLTTVSTDTYSVFVYAFDYPTYQALGGTDVPLLGTSGDATAANALGPSYTTTCSAQQQENIEVLAVCNPLVSHVDGGTMTDLNDAAVDSSVDAADAGEAEDAADSGDAGSDAGDASATDAAG